MTSSSPLPFVLPLDTTLPTQDLTSVLGGKGAHLARMTQLRLPVPSGFVLTTHAFDTIVRNNLQGLTSTASIRDTLASFPLPETILAPLQEAFNTLNIDPENPIPLAVRSSSLDEDNAQNSFAGIQHTVLGVTGFDDLLDAIRKVWASLFSDAASLYRSRTNLEAPAPTMAVVVQKLVQARHAGVCFTADPVQGGRSTLIVSSVPGLGVPVVDGDPSSTWYIERNSNRVLKSDLHNDTHALTFDSESKTLQNTPISDSNPWPHFSDADRARVTSLALQIEGYFHDPQDIEWAFDHEGGLWALQTRPITTLAAIHLPNDPRPSVWTNINVGEALPGVGTPMTWSILRSFSRQGFEHAFGALGLDVPPHYELVDSFYGRVYLNLTQFASIITQIPFMSPANLLSVAGGPSSAELLEGTYDEHPSNNFLRRLPRTVPRAITSQLTTPLHASRWAKKLRKKRDAFFQSNLSQLPLAALEHKLHQADDLFNQTGTVMLECSSNFLASYIATHELLQRWGGPAAAAREHSLFSGLTHLRSAEPGLAILRMAHRVRAHNDLQHHILHTNAETLAIDFTPLASFNGGPALRKDLEDFLHHYGHRAPREAEIATPRWREDPTFIFHTLQTYLKAPFLPSPEQLAEERRQVRKDTTQTIRKHFTTGLGWVFRKSLTLSQINARLREDLRACVVDTLSMYRHVFLEIGRRMVDRTLLHTPSDVFFLTQDEARRFLISPSECTRYPVHIAVRRAAYEAFQKTPEPPETFSLLKGRIIPTEEHNAQEGGDTLQGLPGSAGRITARARVIFDPHNPENRLQPGEILVAPFTDTGWTPLFLAAAGVVMEKGGPLSHSSIVAREYGIPAAVNVKTATTRIQTGDLITLDGDAGRVYLSTLPTPSSET